MPKYIQASVAFRPVSFRKVCPLRGSSGTPPSVASKIRAMPVTTDWLSVPRALGEAYRPYGVTRHSPPLDAVF